MLWKRSLVMYDKETDTYWSHILGRAMDGELVGKSLEQIPAVITDWEHWKRSHPKTTVLWMSRSHEAFTVNYYRGLHKYVLGISTRTGSFAWRLSDLLMHPVLNYSLDSEPVVVAFDDRSATARLYSRKMNGKILEFAFVDKQMIDTETHSQWDPVSGKCVFGKHLNKRLQPMPAFLSFLDAWQRFQPDSDYWSE